VGAEDRPLAVSLPTAYPCSGGGGTVNLQANGIVKDWNPPGGIDAILGGTVNVNPGAKVWAPSTFYTTPQGSGIVNIANTNLTPQSPFDGGFLPRPGMGDDGFYSTVLNHLSAKYFSCSLKVDGLSGSVQPVGGGLDHEVFWIARSGFLGSWLPNTAYTLNQYVIGTLGDTNIWRCTSAGTSNPSDPTWSSAANFGDSIADGPDVLWRRTYNYRGAWSSSTAYAIGISDLGGAAQHVANDFVTVAGGVGLIWSGVGGTAQSAFSSYAKSGTVEPSWDAAGSISYWIDNEVLWINGRDLFGRMGGTDQQERFVITGIQAPAGGSGSFTVANTGTGQMDVVLSDKDATVSGHGAETAPGQDMRSANANLLAMGGTSIRLGPTQSRVMTYNGGTGFWN
jgi:hypothetical protein